MLRKFFLFAFCGMALLPVCGQQTQSAPIKIRVKAVNPQNLPGANVPLTVELLDVRGNPTRPATSVDVQVQVAQPSGRVDSYPVTFSPGESEKQISVPITETGVAKVTVRQPKQQLIGGSSFLLVRAPTSQKKAAHKAAHAVAHPGPGARVVRPPVGNRRGPKLIFAAYPTPQVPAPEEAATATPKIAWGVSGEDVNGGTRADGATCAQVQAFYMGPTDQQGDIQIWLSFSNGNLDNNPIVIHKETGSGNACWTSKAPIPAATLAIAAIKPASYTAVPLTPGGDPKQVTHKFTDNIAGLKFQNCPKSLTIVDSFDLTAVFQSPEGSPVHLTDPRPVHFSADHAFLKLNPLSTTVPQGGFDSSTNLIPTYFGKTTVEASTPDFPTITAVIQINFLGVLIASLIGGFLGGVLAWLSEKGKPVTCIVSGIIVGLVASWAYVIVGLPKVQTPFLHNQISVLFVALLVGLSGVKGLTFIAEKFALPTP